MPENDTALLERFSCRADAEAFAELVRRYAKLVYSTSWRVLKRETDAADVTQETFFELTRQAGRIAGPLSGWLHRVAVQKSIDVIRRQSHRRNREQTYARGRPVEVRTWHDLSASVDDALEQLDESVRSLLLDRFLAGKTTGQIAREQGVSQATASRRINEGLERLRGILRRQGLLVGGAALSTILMESTSQAVVPAAVSVGLSKMAMVGTTGMVAGVGGQTALALNAGAVKAVLTAATVVAAASVVGYLHHSHRPPSTAQPSIPAQVARQTVPTSAVHQSYSANRPAAAPEPSPAGEAAAAVPPPATEETPTDEPLLGPFGPSEETPAMGGMAVGDPFGGIPTTDLRTPEATVYSFLALIDQGAVDQLPECLAEGAQIPPDAPYPRYLGQPIRLVDVAQTGDTAEVRWEATAHKPFSYRGKDRRPGEFVPLSSRLMRVDGRWKIRKLDE